VDRVNDETATTPVSPAEIWASYVAALTVADKADTPGHGAVSGSDRGRKVVGSGRTHCPGDAAPKQSDSRGPAPSGLG
jgi:hypothetical protein